MTDYDAKAMASEMRRTAQALRDAGHADVAEGNQFIADWIEAAIDQLSVAAIERTAIDSCLRSAGIEPRSTVEAYTSLDIPGRVERLYRRAEAERLRAERAFDALAAARADVETLRAALDLAQRGCGSAVWVANNEHQYKASGQMAHGFIVSMGLDAQRGYNAAAAALAQSTT